MESVRFSPARAWALVFVVAGCGALSLFPPDGGTSPDSGLPEQDGGFDASVGLRIDSGAPPTPCNGSIQPVGTIQIPWTSSCPTYSPCGGDPTGTWTYASACIDNPFSAAAGLCPGLTTTSATGTVQGCVAVGGGLVQRDVSWSATTSVHVPQGCLVTPVTDCLQLQYLVANYVAGSTCAVSDGGTDDAGGPGCDCNVTLSGGAHDTTPYSIRSNTLTTTPDGGTSHTFDYCVMGSTLSHKETDTNSPPMPGTYQLNKN